MSTAEEKCWFEAVASLGACVLCGRNDTQVSHSNIHRGMSQKSAPYMTACICRTCHNDIDNGKIYSKIERREMHARAINLTHAKLIESGRLQPV